MTETFRITLEKMVYGGDCLGRLPDGRAVFVPFTLPGEDVTVEIVEDKKRYAHARPTEIHQAAPYRIQPRCIHFGECGGCHYQNMDYAKQLEIKKNILVDQLIRIGHIEKPPVKNVVTSPTAWHYRNHVQFQLTKEGPLAFVHADGEHLLIIEECHLPQEEINDIWPQMELGPEPPFYRLGIRVDSFDERMLILEGEEADPPKFSVDIPISAVYTPTASRLTVLAGQDHLNFEILNHHFHVSARSFFQVNTPMAEKMVQFISDNLTITPETHVLELYAGVGLFSVFLAEKAGYLTAVESSGTACHDFALNLDSLNNVTLYEANAAKALQEINKQDEEFQVVVMDPPRSGLTNKAHDALGQIMPNQIAYISCDPATLARDSKKIIQKGYQLLSTTPFDLFPQTYHIESISIFEKRATD